MDLKDMKRGRARSAQAGEPGDFQEATAVHTSTIQPKTSASILTRRDRAGSRALGAAGQAVRVFAFALLAALAVEPLAAQIQSVVATSPVTLNASVTGGPVVTDACGDIYEYGQDGSTGIIEIEAGTGTVVTIVKNTQGYASGTGLFMDRAKQYLYFPDMTNYYTNHFDRVPIVNCRPGTLNNNWPNNVGYPFGDYYFGTLASGAGDANGDVFFTATQGTNGQIVDEVYTASTTSYSPINALASWPNQIPNLVSDAAGDLYFADSTNKIYYLGAGTAAAPYPAAPTLFSSAFIKIVGLSMDPAGNIYVSDTGNSTVPSAIWEIPNESTGPNPAHRFMVAQLPLVGAVSVDQNGTIYAANYTSGAFLLKRSAAQLPPANLGSTSTVPVNYVFNASVTPTAISTVTGTSASTTLAAGTGGCKVGTAYAANGTCSVTVTYTPSSVGLQTGALQFVSASGTINTQLAAIGGGAAATIDPGTVVATTTVLTAPTGIAVDNLNNVYVTDATANTLTEFASGSAGVGTTVSTGSLTLSKPSAVAVDNVGDIFIADTGNNRVVEIPVVGGALKNTAAAALGVTLKAPQGVATDGAGNLYIADTGDNNLLFIPNINGSLATSAAQSFGASLSSPTAVTVDPNGTVYLAESGNNDLLQFVAPLGSAAQIKVASGLSGPTALSTDASGSVFVVDSGSGSVFRYPNVGGNFGARTLAGSTVVKPTGVATDAFGNLYVTDATDSVVAQVQRVVAALQFGGWNVGTTSTPFTATISNSGNAAITFKTPDYTVSGNTAAGFAVTGDTCKGTTQLAGGSCAITATFTPPVPELNAQENLTLASNAANGTPILQLVGTGAKITPSTLSLVLTSPANATTLNAGQPVTFTATIGTGASTATPGGSVKFYVSGNQVGTVAVKNGVAAITLANGLPAGNAIVVSAVYTGDVINYSGSTAQLTENVVALPDTLAMTITAASLWNNPLSANDNPANAKGPALNLIATVTPSAATIPTGTVTFYAGTTVLGIAQVTPGSGGTFQAGLVTTALRAGSTTQVEDDSFITTYSLSAVYSGDNTYYGSTAPSVPISIVSGPATQPACATSTPATCNKNTTGAFYTITPANPTITATSTTVGGPSSGSTTLTINSYGGWNGILNFTCSGLPAYATCAPFPGYPNGVPSTPGAPVTPTTVDFIINTNVTPIVPTGSGSMVWWMAGGTGLMLLVLRRRIHKLGHLRSGHLLTVLGAALLLGAASAGIGGCSSQAYGFITPAGTSTVTVHVSAAQIMATSTVGSTNPPDPNPTTFQITLVVK